jgi:predicted porin
VNYQSFSFAAQFLPADQDVPASDDTANREIAFNDSFGVSFMYKMPFDIGLGLAYNTVELSLREQAKSILNAEDELLTAHITYRSFGNEGLHVAFVYTDMSNHDMNDVGELMNKSTGMELFSEYRFDNDFSLIFGFNSLEDNSTIDIGSNGNYHLQYFILSAKYNWDDNFYIYLESKIDDSTLSNNSKAFAEDATAIGMMYTF